MLLIFSGIHGTISTSSERSVEILNVRLNERQKILARVEVPQPCGALGTGFVLYLNRPSTLQLQSLEQMELRADTRGYIRTTVTALRKVHQPKGCKDGDCLPMLFIEDALCAWWDTLRPMAQEKSSLVYLDKRQGTEWTGRVYLLSDLSHSNDFVLEARICNGEVKIITYVGAASDEAAVKATLQVLQNPAYSAA